MQNPPPRHFVVAGLACFSLVLAACGSGPAAAGAQVPNARMTHSAHATSQSSGSSKDASEIAYTQCMRKNGVPNFPDPNSNGSISISSSEGINLNSPLFKAAQSKCQSLLPRPSVAQQQKAERTMLEFSQCMRENGVPNYPDPSANGSLSLHSGDGIDPNSPLFEKAQSKCAKLFHMPAPLGAHGPGTQSSGGQGEGMTLSG